MSTIKIKSKAIQEAVTKVRRNNYTPSSSTATRVPPPKHRSDSEANKNKK